MRGVYYECDHCGTETKQMDGNWIHVLCQQGTATKENHFCSLFCYMRFHKEFVEEYERNLDKKVGF